MRMSMSTLMRLAERRFGRISCAVLAIALLQGCAAAVVGGAATGVAVIHDRRSTGTILDDQTIELKALALVSERKDLAEHSSIDVTSYNYVLLLTGRIETEMQRSSFAVDAGKISGVRRVVNELEIGPVLSLGQKANDSYLTAKVKTLLLNVKVPSFDPTRVKVVTSNGIVYLLGLVTKREAEAVVNETRMVGGVRKVVRVFEYITD